MGKPLKLKITAAPSLGQRGTPKGGDNANTNENRIPVFQELANEPLLFSKRIRVIQVIPEIEEIWRNPLEKGIVQVSAAREVSKLHTQMLFLHPDNVFLLR